MQRTRRPLTRIIFISLVVVTFGPDQPRVGAQPPSGDRALLERVSRRVEDRARELEAEADALAEREQALLNEMDALETDRQIKADELAAINLDLEEMVDQLETTEARISELAASAARQRPAVEARLVELYKLGSPGYARLLLEAENIRSLGRAYRLLGILARRDQVRFEGHRETLAHLETSRGSLESRQAEMARMQQGALNARRAVDRAIAAQTTLLDNLDTERGLTAIAAGELDAARERLEAARSALDAGEGFTLDVPLTPFRGRLRPPVDGELQTPFGVPRAAGDGLVESGQGIELAARPDEAVYAVHGGEVLLAGRAGTLGNVVVLDHGNQSYSVYGHLASLAVHEGVRVQERTLVGTAGTADGAENDMLYFELRVDGQSVDPIEWLSGPR